MEQLEKQSFMQQTKIVYVVFLLLASWIFPCSAQDDIINDQATLFRIPNAQDTIEFIVVNTNLSDRKPLLLWCQGSLPYPLFVKANSGELYLMGGGVSNFDYQNIKEDYHLVVISMPKTPVIADERDLNASYWYASKTGNEPIEEFLRNDYLENYVNRATKVISFLKKKTWIDKKKIIVAGHSQGAKVAVQIGAENKSVTHIGLFSANLFGRMDQMIRQARKDAEQGKISWEEAITQMEGYYALYSNSNSIQKQQSDPSLIAWQSFSTPQIEKLSTVKKPIYLAYGTSDIISDLNDLAPLYFIRNKNEQSLTIKPYPNLDHNFFELDDNGQPDRTKKHWNKVFMSFLEWVAR